jgi:hypothetical protein
MFYIINNDSELSLAQQIAICDTFVDLNVARRVADRKRERTGEDWVILQIKEV